MLNFAEQTGSGAVIVVWSFLTPHVAAPYRNLPDATGWLLLSPLILPFFALTGVRVHHLLPEVARWVYIVMLARLYVVSVRSQSNGKNADRFLTSDGQTCSPRLVDGQTCSPHLVGRLARLKLEQNFASQKKSKTGRGTLTTSAAQVGLVSRHNVETRKVNSSIRRLQATKTVETSRWRKTRDAGPL